jgi:hypothetical protein
VVMEDNRFSNIINAGAEMRIKLYIDKKMKADLPENINTDKFMDLLRVFWFEPNWKNIEIRQEIDKCVKKQNASTTQKQADVNKA